MDPKEIIARRAAEELSDGNVVNLGLAFRQWWPIYSNGSISFYNPKTDYGYG
jgi:acyl CoA:acetate/3-ketoacid CoA transferase beta subunit